MTPSCWKFGAEAEAVRLAAWLYLHPKSVSVYRELPGKGLTLTKNVWVVHHTYDIHYHDGGLLSKAGTYSVFWGKHQCKNFADDCQKNLTKEEIDEFIKSWSMPDEPHNEPEV